MCFCSMFGANLKFHLAKRRKYEQSSLNNFGHRQFMSRACVYYSVVYTGQHDETISRDGDPLFSDNLTDL